MTAEFEQCVQNWMFFIVNFDAFRLAIIILDRERDVRLPMTPTNANIRLGLLVVQ
jgi:hypothetical protein